MDALYLYSLIVGVIVFGLAVPLGYFVFARFAHRETLSFFFSRATELETARRDRLFLPLTRRMTAVSPNAITIIGFLIIAALVCLFLIGVSLEIIFLGVLLAGFTDMLDGPLARNNGRVTPLGARLDWTRDLCMTVVVGVFLVAYMVLPMAFLVWFLTGWAIIGVLRVLEFKAASGTLMHADEEDKFIFILDRVRLVLIWFGALLLILKSHHPLLGTAGTMLAMAAIVIAWFSVLLHAAHLKILRRKPAMHR